MSTRRERFLQFVADHERPGVTEDELAGLMDEWCESEVRLALRPSAPCSSGKCYPCDGSGKGHGVGEVCTWCGGSGKEMEEKHPSAPIPELAEAIYWIHEGGFSPPKMSALIAAELDRRAGEIARLTALCQEAIARAPGVVAMSLPEDAAELIRLRARVAELEAQVAKYQAGGLLMPEEDAAKIGEG